jgi:nucleoid-associated protein YgaU
MDLGRFLLFTGLFAAFADPLAAEDVMSAPAFPAPSFNEPAVSTPQPDAPAESELPSSPAVSGRGSMDSPPAAAGNDAKKTYKVWIWQENGDTLWRIAQKVYGDKDKWPLIYAANKDVLKDPHKIYPKQVLKIPPVDWQP